MSPPPLPRSAPRWRALAPLGLALLLPLVAVDMRVSRVDSSAQPE